MTHVPRSANRARYEASIYSAARALLTAIDAAEQLADHGAVADLTLIRIELKRMCDTSIAGKPLRRRTSLLPSGDDAGSPQERLRLER